MKNVLAFVAGMLVMGLVLGVAGFAFAQSQTPPQPEVPYGYGMMGSGYGMMGGGRGMMAARGTGQYGPMHTYMVDGFAQALGLTSEDVQSQIDSGKTMYQIALDQGKTAEEIPALMQQVHTAALQAAVEAGAITQEQADWMSQHMAQRWASGTAPCYGANGQTAPRSPRWRANP